MLRIIEIHHGAGERTIQLEGKLLEPWVDEVSRVVMAQAAPRRAGLDLSAVTYVDAAGRRLLRELMDRGVAVKACSAFVAELLGREIR